MIKDIVEAGGAGFLIPAVLLALLVAGIKGFFGLFGHKSLTRKEFIEHWDASRVHDDVWLEVTVRHQFGVYLPARVIRLALEQPHKTQALIDLSAIWPLLRFEPAAMQVAWKQRFHDSRRKRVIVRRLLLSLYFGLFLLAFLAGWASHLEPANSPAAWIYGVAAAVLALFAFMAIEREDALDTAAREGDAWVERINNLTAPVPTMAPAALAAESALDAACP